MAHAKVEIGPAIAGTKKWATTLTLPTTRRGWFWVGFTAFVVIAVIILPLYGVRLLGITPLAGRSMEPTLKAMSTWPHIAAYYRSSREPIELGCLVEFRTEGEDGVLVKRVVDISDDDQRVWVKADNFGVTGKDSDTDYGWINTSSCKKITWLWTPARALRGRSAEGRLRNWAELYGGAPASIEWGPGTLWVAQYNKEFAIFSGTSRLMETEGMDPHWETGNICFFRGEGYYQLNIQTLEVTKVRDGASVITYRRNPDSDILWKGEAMYMPVFDAWSLPGKIASISPEIVKGFDKVEVSAKGKSFRLAGPAEYHPEAEYSSFPGGITVLYIDGGLTGEPNQKIKVSLKLTKTCPLG